MTENKMLRQAIGGQQATIASLSEAHKKEVDALNARIKELTAQVAWLNRQLYGRKSEKLPVYDPNYPDLFADQFGDLLRAAEEKRDEAVEQLPKEEKQAPKQKRQVRRKLEDLPVLETVRRGKAERV